MNQKIAFGHDVTDGYVLKSNHEQCEIIESIESIPDTRWINLDVTSSRGDGVPDKVVYLDLPPGSTANLLPTDFDNPAGYPGREWSHYTMNSASWSSVPDVSDYFTVRFVDESAGRAGVPGVTLSVDNQIYVSDNRGRIAFYESRYMGGQVEVSIATHGYTLPSNSPGYIAPKTLQLEPEKGGAVEISMTRHNLAIRKRRLTGAGLFGESKRLGFSAEPWPNSINTDGSRQGRVAGQDTVMVTPYKNSLFWVWGDTLNLDNALGNFRVTGATSTLPQPFSGLPSDAGIDYEYFLDSNGRNTKKMAPLDAQNSDIEKGLIWLGQLFTLNDDGEKLYARWGSYEDLSLLDHGMAVYDDSEEVFKNKKKWDLPCEDGVTDDSEKNCRIPKGNINYRVVSTPEGSKEYLYMGSSLRITANEDAIIDQTQWEFFTPFEQGSTHPVAADDVKTDERGRLVYRWQPNTARPQIRNFKCPVGDSTCIEASTDNDVKLQPNDFLFVPYVVNDFWEGALGTPTVWSLPHGNPLWGAVPVGQMQVYNPYRNRWVSIMQEVSGETSWLGEIWYSEADTPMGPWIYARKVVSHDAYSFYNPQLHPWFDEDNGRKIHFEGTYTTYLTNSDPTPRYDYNQILYSLDLSEVGLRMPVPVYTFEQRGSYGQRTIGVPSMVTRNGLHPDMTAVNIEFLAPEKETALAKVPVSWEGSPCDGYEIEIGGDSSNAQFFLIDKDLTIGAPHIVPVKLIDSALEGERPRRVLVAQEGGPDAETEGYAYKYARNITFPVIENLGPLHAQAGTDICAAYGTTVNLDASKSIVEKGDPTYQWEGVNVSSDAVNVDVSPIYQPLQEGVHEFTLTVTDADQRVREDTVKVEIVPPPNGCG